MSRSYKKHLWTKLVSRSDKRAANRRVRRTTEEIPNGNSYRRIYEQWDVCDQKWLYDPRPRWRSWSQEWIEPRPVWKVCKK